MNRIRRLRVAQRSEHNCKKSRSRKSVVILTALTLSVAMLSTHAQVTTGAFSAQDSQYLHLVAEPLLRVEQSPSAVVQPGARLDHRELLLMEPRVASQKNSSNREADVYIYDYSTDEVIHLIVNLDDRSIARRERVQNVQLPLTPVEVKRAIDIVFVDESNKRAIGEEFYRITGRQLESAQQIQYKAFVFLAASVSEAKSVNTRDCGLSRCAKLLLYTADNMALDLSPIVNLSNEQVLQIADTPREGG